jgi:Uma2 family endonuclease
MSTVATEKRVTPEDLLAMPEGERYELVDGQLVEHTMSTWSSYVAGVMLWLLTSFCRERNLGWVLPEGTTYQCFPDAPNTVRRTDVSFIRRERMSFEQAIAPGHNRIAPDLAVEVVSPNDLLSEVNEKVQEYLRARVQLVWVVDPEARIVQVHRLRGQGTILRENDELEGEDVLPGFRCRVADLFAPPAGVVLPA